MSATIAELTAKRQTLHGKIKDLAGQFDKNGKRWDTDQQRKDWAALNTEYDQVVRELDEATAADRVTSRMSQIDQAARQPINPRGIGLDDAGDGMVGGRPAPGGLNDANLRGREYVVDHRGRRQPVLRSGDSLVAELLRADPAIGAEHQGLGLGEYLRAMVIGPKTSAERNALSEGSDSGGGYTVPTRLAAELIDLLRAQSRVMQAGASTIQLDTEQTSYAKLTAEPTPVWRHENVEVSEQTATFGKINFHARSLAMLVKAGRELLEDSININSALPKVFARAMGSEVDRVALMGVGAGTGDGTEPLGVFNFPGISTVSMGDNGAEVADYSQILDAVEAIETANAMTPTAAIMHPRTRRAYAGLTDTTDQPLRRPEALANLLFLPTTKIPINQTQGTANDASPVLLGGFEELVIATRTEVRIEVLRERYAENLQYGFLVYLRADVGAWHEQAFARILGVIPPAA